MKIAIIGSRTIKNIDFSCLNITNNDTVISGGAIGVDSLIKKYCQENFIKIIEYLPDYKRYGRAATHVRNDIIIKEADIIFAFWDGQSRGTKSVIEKCRRNKKRVEIFKV